MGGARLEELIGSDAYAILQRELSKRPLYRRRRPDKLARLQAARLLGAGAARQLSSRVGDIPIYLRWPLPRSLTDRVVEHTKRACARALSPPHSIVPCGRCSESSCAPARNLHRYDSGPRHTAGRSTRSLDRFPPAAHPRAADSRHTCQGKTRRSGVVARAGTPRRPQTELVHCAEFAASE